MPTEPRTARGRATRERIVAAATELVAERGVAGTSLDAVRERASASKSQLYLYFADRDELLCAVARASCQATLVPQHDLLAGCDSIAGIERYFAALVGLQRERQARGGCPIGSLAGQLAERDERARQALADGFDDWERALNRGIEAMADRALLAASVDPARLATQILAAIQGGLLLTQVRRDPAQLRIAADGALELLRAALVAGPE